MPIDVVTLTVVRLPTCSAGDAGAMARRRLGLLRAQRALRVHAALRDALPRAQLRGPGDLAVLARVRDLEGNVDSGRMSMDAWNPTKNDANRKAG